MDAHGDAVAVRDAGAVVGGDADVDTDTDADMVGGDTDVDTDTDAGTDVDVYVHTRVLSLCSVSVRGTGFRVIPTGTETRTDDGYAAWDVDRDVDGDVDGGVDGDVDMDADPDADGQTS